MNELTSMEQINVVANVQQGSIKFNYEETKVQLAAVLEEYQNAVFSDESIKVAKVIVAELRAKQKEFDKRRKEVKTEYNKTLTEFEEKAKELYAMFDTPINFIMYQVEGYEERRKAEKKAKCIELYESVIGDYKEYLPLSKVYNARWENATFKMADVEKELMEVVNSTCVSLQTIAAMNSEAVEKALQLFKNDLSLANAITYINNYEKQKVEILEREKEKQRQEEERKRQQEEDRIRQEERNRILAEQKAEQEKLQAIEQAKREKEQEILAIKEVDEVSFFQERLLHIFNIIGTTEEIEQVKIYLNSIGIEYNSSLVKEELKF